MHLIGVFQKRVRGADKYGRQYIGRKKYWTIYYIDDQKHFRTRVVTRLQALYYKYFVKKYKARYV